MSSILETQFWFCKSRLSTLSPSLSPRDVSATWRSAWKISRYSRPRHLLVDERGVCPSIENVIVWWSKDVLGRTAVGDVRMASSFLEITASSVWLDRCVGPVTCWTSPVDVRMFIIQFTPGDNGSSR